MVGWQVGSVRSPVLLIDSVLVAASGVVRPLGTPGHWILALTTSAYGTVQCVYVCMYVCICGHVDDVCTHVCVCSRVYVVYMWCVCSMYVQCVRGYVCAYVYYVPVVGRSTKRRRKSRATTSTVVGRGV